MRAIRLSNVLLGVTLGMALVMLIATAVFMS